MLRFNIMKHQRQANLIKRFIALMVLEVQGHDTGLGSVLMGTPWST